MVVLLVVKKDERLAEVLAVLKVETWADLLVEN